VHFHTSSVSLVRSILRVVAISLIALPVVSAIASESRMMADLAIDIEIPIPQEDDRSGGLIAADVDGNGILDFLVTRPGAVVAVAQSGRLLWHHEVDVQVTMRSERNGLPGHHGPGIQVADIWGTGEPSVLYLTRDGMLRIVRGADGEVLEEIEIASPTGTERWEHLVVANFRGLGDRDLLLQATNADVYRMGRFIAAYAIEELISAPNPMPLWKRDDFLAAAHSGARVADISGDGLDEVFSGSIIGPDGAKLYEIPIRGHIDAMLAADVIQERPGLEVVALEEGGGKWVYRKDWVFPWINDTLNLFWPSRNRVFVFDENGLVWNRAHDQREPQNVAVGQFIPDSEVQIWNRSRFDVDQRPFVFDAGGRMIAEYELSRIAPEGWTREGVEVISSIYWTGGPVQHIAAKERHRNGHVALLEPLTGRFVLRIPEQANRLYVADVLGDWREEIVVLSGRRIRIYTNPRFNLRPDRPSLWGDQHYRRLKQTWNYYNP